MTKKIVLKHQKKWSPVVKKYQQIIARSKKHQKNDRPSKKHNKNDRPS